MSSTPIGNERLERERMRRSVDDLSADTDLQRCADCRRTPLVGERVYRFAGEVLVCELCRCLRAEEPLRSERVRHSEAGQTVKLTARVARHARV
jgi:hypothetical protein